MAPEMLLFKPYSSAVDIFSLGVVMSELDTHELPYYDASEAFETDEAIARQVIHHDLRPTFRSECPSWYRELAQRCMAIEPSARPTAPEVIYQLKTQLRECP
ncbi:Aste57867_4507 [Aphanomyces stellatus]|uniref:Aste57867_4507 protein n=1 Tax=Aphanomyces stellatus TaxID=120398 RepID=A0A485KE07_9STRA|nr:hypothetical protein As57867_004494 [Aphanomyces stellatus]VFT81617.1 Aste57867_4507 [Aphanomyces stellatus]